MLNNRTATGKAAGSAAAAALPSVAPTARHPVQPGAPKRASTVSEAVAQAPAATTLSSTYVTKEARKALFSTANEQVWWHHPYLRLSRRRLRWSSQPVTYCQ